MIKTPTVSSYDEDEIKRELKTCPLIIQKYVKSLKDSIEQNRILREKMIKKIRDLSKNHEN